MSIECLKCHEKVVKLRLTDHIAAHFDYFPHLCDDCSFSCYNPQEAAEHEVIHNHYVLQNKAKNNYVDNLCMGIYKDCLLASKYGEDYVISNGFAAIRKNNVPTGELVPPSQSLNVPASMNLVKNVGESSPVPKNVAVDLKKDVVYLSSRKGNVSSSEDGNADDVLYVPPKKISDVREKESLPVIKRAGKRAQPSVSLVDKDNNVANLQLISDCTMCRLCGHEVFTDAGKRSHVGSIHLNLSLACPFCDFVFYGEEKAAVHLQIHGLNPNALEGEEKVAVVKEWNIYFKEMEEMFEKCFPPRVVQDEISTDVQSSKGTSLHVQSTTEVSACLVCNMKVTSKAGRRAHVSDCHLKHTLVCPKAECDFETFKEVSMAKHLKGEHKIERFKLDAEERSKYIQMLAVFVKKLKPVLQMCFPHSASFASADLKSKKAVSAQLTSIPDSVLSNLSAPHGSQKMSPNKFSITKKTIQTTSLTRSSSSSSSDRKKKTKPSSLESKSDRKRLSDQTGGAEMGQPDAKKRLDLDASNQLRHPEKVPTRNSSPLRMASADLLEKQSKEHKTQQVLPGNVEIKIEQD